MQGIILGCNYCNSLQSQRSTRNILVQPFINYNSSAIVFGLREIVTQHLNYFDLVSIIEIEKNTPKRHIISL